ncbi:hypothetical protein D1872_213660 [compost metagenome]
MDNGWVAAIAWVLWFGAASSAAQTAPPLKVKESASKAAAYFVAVIMNENPPSWCLQLSDVL